MYVTMGYSSVGYITMTMAEEYYNMAHTYRQTIVMPLETNDT